MGPLLYKYVKLFLLQNTNEIVRSREQPLFSEWLGLRLCLSSLRHQSPPSNQISWVYEIGQRSNVEPSRGEERCVGKRTDRKEEFVPDLSELCR